MSYDRSDDEYIRARRAAAQPRLLINGVDIGAITRADLRSVGLHPLRAPDMQWNWMHGDRDAAVEISGLTFDPRWIVVDGVELRRVLTDDTAEWRCTVDAFDSAGTDTDAHRYIALSLSTRHQHERIDSMLSGSVHAVTGAPLHGVRVTAAPSHVLRRVRIWRDSPADHPHSL